MWDNVCNINEIVKDFVEKAISEAKEEVYEECCLKDASKVLGTIVDRVVFKANKPTKKVNFGSPLEVTCHVFEADTTHDSTAELTTLISFSPDQPDCDEEARVVPGNFLASVYDESSLFNEDEERKAIFNSPMKREANESYTEFIDELHKRIRTHNSPLTSEDIAQQSPMLFDLSDCHHNNSESVVPSNKQFDLDISPILPETSSPKNLPISPILKHMSVCDSSFNMSPALMEDVQSPPSKLLHFLPELFDLSASIKSEKDVIPDAKNQHNSKVNLSSSEPLLTALEESFILFDTEHSASQDSKPKPTSPENLTLNISPMWPLSGKRNLSLMMENLPEKASESICFQSLINRLQSDISKTSNIKEPQNKSQTMNASPEHNSKLEDNTLKIVHEETSGDFVSNDEYEKFCRIKSHPMREVTPSDFLTEFSLLPVDDNSIEVDRFLMPEMAEPPEPLYTPCDLTSLCREILPNSSCPDLPCPVERFVDDEEPAIIKQFEKTAQESAVIKQFEKTAQESAVIKQFEKTAQESVVIKQFEKTTQESAVIKQFDKTVLTLSLDRVECEESPENTRTLDIENKPGVTSNNTVADSPGLVKISNRNNVETLEILKQVKSSKNYGPDTLENQDNITGQIDDINNEQCSPVLMESPCSDEVHEEENDNTIHHGDYEEDSNDDLREEVLHALRFMQENDCLVKSDSGEEDEEQSFLKNNISDELKNISGEEDELKNDILHKEDKLQMNEFESVACFNKRTYEHMVPCEVEEVHDSPSMYSPVAKKPRVVPSPEPISDSFLQMPPSPPQFKPLASMSRDHEQQKRDIDEIMCQMMLTQQPVSNLLPVKRQISFDNVADDDSVVPQNNQSVKCRKVEPQQATQQKPAKKQKFNDQKPNFRWTELHQPSSAAEVPFSHEPFIRYGVKKFTTPQRVRLGLSKPRKSLHKR